MQSRVHRVDPYSSMRPKFHFEYNIIITTVVSVALWQQRVRSYRTVIAIIQRMGIPVLLSSKDVGIPQAAIEP